MHQNITVTQFTAKASSAGVVNVMLGFIPDFAIFISGFDQTNPDVYLWANGSATAGEFGKFALWGSERHLKITGSTGVITVVTTASQVLDLFAGGTTVSTAETTNSDPKHVNEQGTELTAASSTTPIITKQGMRIPSQIQTASAKNLLLAWRNDK
jgi:hypothetical protein